MITTTPTLMRTLALAMALALPVLPMAAGANEAQAEAGSASFQTRLMQQLREVQHRAQQPQWVNRWAPAVSVPAPAALNESGDGRLQAHIGTYTRARLDRGGWVNPWAGGGTEAGEPLLTVAVGSGLTSRGEPLHVSASLLAAR